MDKNQRTLLKTVAGLFVFAFIVTVAFANPPIENIMNSVRSDTASTEIKVIAFDVFGTVFDLSTADRDDIRDYVRHVKSDEWSPIQLPKSWEYMPAHPDSAEGIERLRKGYTVVTLSNGPVALINAMSKRSGISWDAIVPIELREVYKPNIEAYKIVPELFGVNPSEVLMVTANPAFGDVEAAKSLGWQVAVIRQDDGIQDIGELADSLLKKKTK